MWSLCHCHVAIDARHFIGAPIINIISKKHGNPKKCGLLVHRLYARRAPEGSPCPFPKEPSMRIAGRRILFEGSPSFSASPPFPLDYTSLPSTNVTVLPLYRPAFDFVPAYRAL